MYDNEAIKTVLVHQDTGEELRQEIAWRLLGKIIDPVEWDNMNDSNSVIIRPTSNPSFKTRDSSLINEFHFKVVQLKATLLFTNRYIKKARLSAQNLKDLLEYEYDIE